MLVYRIEDSEGRGAFHDVYVHHDVHACNENLKEAYIHPSPHSWGERGTELSAFFSWGSAAAFRFGCRSKPQLRMWFRSERGRTAMAEAGGVMVTYSVPDEHVKRGRYQVAFDITKATKLSAIPANQW